MTTLLMTSKEHYLYMNNRQSKLPVSVVMLHHESSATINYEVNKRNLRSDIPLFGCKDLEEIYIESELLVDMHQRHNIVTTLLNSYITFFLIDRSRGRFPPTNFLEAHRVDSMVAGSIYVLKKYRIKKILSCSTPHSIEFYVFAKVAQMLGIKVFIIENSPILHRYWNFEWGDKKSKTSTVFNTFNATTKSLSGRTKKFVEELQKTGGNYEKIALDLQMEKYKKLEISLMSEIKIHWKKLMLRPHNLLSTIKKVQLAKMYGSLSTENPDLNTPYIIYFLHYQPERTSLPEGNQFVLQHLAIRLLVSTVPEGWKIYVKEHPSTWMLPMNIMTRNSDYYKTLNQMKNIVLVDSSVSTNKLIDNSKAVATLTGKVGIQAIVRGKPVIAFGDALYHDHPMCYSIDNINDLENAIHSIQKNELTHDQKERQLEIYLKWVESVSTEAPDDWNALNHRARRLARFEGMRIQIMNILNSSHSVSQG